LLRVNPEHQIGGVTLPERREAGSVADELFSSLCRTQMIL
jgi:hypothetical protein